MSGPELSEPEASRAWDRGRRLPVVPRWLGLIALVVALLGAGAWVIGRQLTSTPASRHNAVNVAYATFRDPAGLFQGGYPSSWKPIQTGIPQVVLLAQGPGGASYEVRKSSLTAPVNATNLVAARKLTDRVVSQGPGVRLIATKYRQPAQVSVGGLPGLLYLYTFVDPTTGETGAHAHYFLFDGKTMITLVFQALPSTNFKSLAPVFDNIARAFHALRH
jgi:hypothetical protein